MLFCYTCYYFTARNWTDPIDEPQIPVRAVVNGTQLQQHPNETNYRSFLHYYEFVDFRATLPDDTSIFEVGVKVQLFNIIMLVWST